MSRPGTFFCCGSSMGWGGGVRGLLRFGGGWRESVAQWEMGWPSPSAFDITCTGSTKRLSVQETTPYRSEPSMERSSRFPTSINVFSVSLPNCEIRSSPIARMASMSEPK